MEAPTVMRPSNHNLLLLAVAAAVWMGGCPLTATSSIVLDEQIGADPNAIAQDSATRQTAELTSGTYYVREADGRLAATALARVRGESTQEFDLAMEADGADWFVGEGFYTFAEEGVWELDDSRAGQSQDDALMLHDPPPAVPRT